MLTYYLFRIGFVLLPPIPAGLVFWLCDCIADLAFWLSPKIRHSVESNMRRVLPEATPGYRRRVAREVVRNNIKNYYDLMRLNWMKPEVMQRQIDLRGLAHLRAAENYGKGTIMVAAHTGSFSFSDQIAEKINVTFNLLVEPIQPPQLFDLVAKLRANNPHTPIIPIGGPGLRNIFRALKRNELVCFASDRDIAGNGTLYPFFGEPAPIPTGAAEVALRTGAVVIAVSVARATNTTHVLDLRPGFLITHSGIVPLTEIESGSPSLAPHLSNEEAIHEGTLKIISEMEQTIRDNPDQWVVLQPIWPNS